MSWGRCPRMPNRSGYVRRPLGMPQTSVGWHGRKYFPRSLAEVQAMFTLSIVGGNGRAVELFSAAELPAAGPAEMREGAGTVPGASSREHPGADRRLCGAQARPSAAQRPRRGHRQEVLSRSCWRRRPPAEPPYVPFGCQWPPDAADGGRTSQICPFPSSIRSTVSLNRANGSTSARTLATSSGVN